MKVATPIFGLLLVALVTTAALAQQPAPAREEPVTKFERFTLSKGTVRVREYYEIGEAVGKYGNVLFSVTRAYTPGQRDAVMALQVEAHESGRIERKRIGILDAEEVAGLVSALPQMLKMAQDLLKTQLPTTTTEIDFKGGSIRVTAFVEGRRSGMAIEAGYVGAVTSFFELSDGPGI